MSDGANDDVGNRNTFAFDDTNEVGQSGSSTVQEQAAVSEDTVSVPSSSEQDPGAAANDATTPSDVVALGANRCEIADEQENGASTPPAAAQQVMPPTELMGVGRDILVEDDDSVVSGITMDPALRADSSPNDIGNGGTDGLDGNTPERQEQEESGVSVQSTAEVASKIELLLKAHQQWRIRKAILHKETTGKPGQYIAILNAMTNSTQVELHSLKKTTNRNGQIGRVVTYNIEKDRFSVKVNDHAFSLRAENLRVLSNDTSESNAETAIQLPLSVDTLANALFREGMFFKGNISIPGLTGQRREYRLVVESCSVMDEMDRSAGILARHKAYDDEQYVFIYVDKSSSNLSIQFADGETQCNGTWNTEKGQFEGSVRQLVPTEDGGSIYYTQDKVTHTFTLSPTTAMCPNGFTNGNDMNQERVGWEQDLISNATQSIANLRHETDQLGFELVDKCEYMCTAINPLSFRLLMYEDLHSLVGQLVLKVQCSELIAINSLAAEKTCALFRRWANLLDKLTFSSAKERSSVLTELQEKGMTRVQAHKESDNHTERPRQVVQTWSVLSFNQSSFSNRPNGDDMTRILVLRARLDRSFKRFDEALRRAEVRLTDDDFQQWIVWNGDDALCTICHVLLHDRDTADDEKVLCLPCSHRFHIECLREWLHHHSQCPVCRLELRSHCRDK